MSKDNKDKSKEAAEKVKDAKDEAFICYCSLQILDRDGIGIKTKGSSVGAPVHLVSAPEADPVVMKACFEANDPLFYLELRNEEQFYLFGQLWMDSAKHSEDKALCQLTPMMTQSIHKSMEKSNTKSFEMQAQCPFLRDCTSRPLSVEGTTVEKKFTTKLSSLTVTIPRAAWMEFKDYRVRFWQLGKNWGGGGGGDDKKDDKDKEKKEGEEEDEGKKES
jgi:hypothetical protein